MSSPLFERTITALLQERVICEVSDDELYNYLLLQANQDSVNRFLVQINRTLRQTSAHDAFVCAYLDTSDADTKDAIRHQFRDVANNLEAFVQFLRLVMMLEANDRPVLPGDKLSEGAILDRIAAAPALESKLRSLAEKKVFHTKRSDSAGQIRAVLSSLEKMGYLKPIGTSGSLYRATGRWSWLYDAMTFIQTHEGIQGSDETDSEQMRLH
ncbi:MAG: hypothetical protein ACI92N_001575 [Pseudomonadales bacterium]|jgi:hypothetical protein